jgi:hypothetical protein
VVFHDIFQQTNTSANSYKDIVIRELDWFCHYHIDGKNNKCALKYGGEKNIKSSPLLQHLHDKSWESQVVRLKFQSSLPC